MTFQAYLDTIKAKTGKTPEDLRKLAAAAGILKADMKAGDLVAWFKQEYGLGHGHSMAVWNVFVTNGWVQPKQTKLRLRLKRNKALRDRVAHLQYFRRLPPSKRTINANSRFAPNAGGMDMEILASNTILYCSNWKRMVVFYQEIMGFQQTFLKDDWFIELRITEGSHLSLADEARCTIKSAGGRGITLSFRVADLRALHRHLTAQGVNPSELASYSWRAPYFYIHDPEGNRIELWNDKAD